MAEHDHSREKYADNGDYITVARQENFGSIVCCSPLTSASARHWPERRARIVACVNALEGYNPDAVRDLTAAIQDGIAQGLTNNRWKAITDAFARLGGAS